VVWPTPPKGVWAPTWTSEDVRPRRRYSGRAWICAAVVVSWLLAGCGITQTPLEVALNDGASSTGSAALAVRGLDDGDLTSPVAQTAIDDAVRAISKAASESAEYKASPGAERRLQERAVGAIARAVVHLHQAQDDLTKPSERARLARALKRDNDELENLSTRAGEIG
jgi:hypothetical protein